MGKKPRRSIGLWLGFGFMAALLSLGIGVVAALGILASQSTRLMADPETVRQRALEILGAEKLPDGYAAEVANSIPFLTDVVVAQGPKAQFVYLGALRSDSAADRSKSLHNAVFVDDEIFDQELRRVGFHLRADQSVLTRGGVHRGPLEARFAFFPGPLDFDVTRSPIFDFDFGELVAGEGDIDPQISAVVLMRCQPDERPVLGMWAGPRLSADPEAESLREQHSGDARAFRQLVEAFGFCHDQDSPPDAGEILGKF